MAKKSFLLKLAVPMAVFGMLVSCNGMSNSSISKSDLLGEWSSRGFITYVFNENGTGMVGSLISTRLYDMEWNLLGDSLFVKVKDSRADAYNGAFRIDSMKTEKMEDKEVEILFLSYVGKNIDPDLYKGYGYNLEGAYDYFLKDVAEGFLTTENGYRWLQTKQGLSWQETEDGKKWLASKDGQKFVEYRDAIKIKQTEWAKLK